MVFKMGDILTPGPYFIAIAGRSLQTAVALPFSTEIENDRGTFASRAEEVRLRRSAEASSFFPLLFSKDGEDRRTG